MEECEASKDAIRSDTKESMLIEAIDGMCDIIYALDCTKNHRNTTTVLVFNCSSLNT